MNRPEFDALVSDLTDVCKKTELPILPLEQVYEAAVGRKDERKNALTKIVAKEAGNDLALDLLMIFDVVAATASLESARAPSSKASVPTAAEVIDLWVRATAARALWYERFVQWPAEQASEKLEHLCDTAKRLGAESIALALARNGQPVKFTSFVGSIGRGTAIK